MKRMLFLIILFVSTIVNAQITKVVRGNFAFLKDVKQVNVEFDYDNFTVKKDSLTEAQYVELKVEELSKKSINAANEWNRKWYESKELIWTPKFMELLNKVHSKKKKDIRFMKNFPSAKYTLVVKTVWVYPGWDAYLVKQAAKVTTVLKFVETTNRDKVLLEISSVDAPGDQFGNNYNDESRIGEGYAKTAKTLATIMLKNAYK